MIAYFEVVPGGPVFEALRSIDEQRQKALAAAREWRDRHKLEHVKAVINGRVFFTEGHIPDKKQWKRVPRKSMVAYTPRDTAMQAEARRLPAFPSTLELVIALCGSEPEKVGEYFHELNQHQPQYYAYGVARDVYRLAADPIWLPEDRTGVQEITASQFAKPDPT